jgi:dTDP-4-dehydrorhamnose 3,5-epimerase
MIFTAAPIGGVYLIDLHRQSDDRGYFERLFCQREFSHKGLEINYPQINCSSSLKCGTLRGMHYQLEPSAEVKVVRCMSGTLWDVVLDLRHDSPTFGQHFGAELSSESGRMMYVPRGFAHGFMTLADETRALYLCSASYDPARERGVRWNDPKFAINWPAQPKVISSKDASHGDYNCERVIGAAGTLTSSS